MAELVDATDSKSVELRFMSVRVGLGVPKLNKKKFQNQYFVEKFKVEYRLCNIKNKILRE